MKSVNDIRNDIQQLAYNEYLRGFEAVLSVLNDSYVKHVWHKEDSEKFFDDVMETIQMLNLRFFHLSEKESK